MTVSRSLRRSHPAQLPQREQSVAHRAVADETAHSIVLSPRKVLTVIVITSLLLVVIGWLFEILSVIPGTIHIPRLITRRLMLGAEQTIPAWYSSLLLFVAALLLGVIASRERAPVGGSRSRWVVLATTFLILSLDESVAIHETIRPTLEKVGLHTQWMFFGAGFVALLAVYLVPWLWSFERRTRNLFFLSAVLFVGGALGVETASGFVARSAGLESIPYISISAVEETLEMLGSCLFIYALLDHLRSGGRGIRVQLE